LDAWVAAHRDAWTDAEVLRELAGEGAEKWAVRARGGQARDVPSPRLALRLELQVRLASGAPCTRAAGQSGARSSEVQEFVVPARRRAAVAALQNEVQPPEPAEQTQPSLVLPVESRMEEAPDEPQERSLAARPKAQPVSPVEPRPAVLRARPAELQQARLKQEAQEVVPAASLRPVRLQACERAALLAVPAQAPRLPSVV